MRSPLYIYIVGHVAGRLEEFKLPDGEENFMKPAAVGLSVRGTILLPIAETLQ